MRRVLPLAGAMVLALGLVMLFWWTAPSVEPAAPVDAAEVGVSAVAGARPRPVADRPEDDEPGPPPGMTEDEYQDEMLAERGSVRQMGPHGSLPRLRKLVTELEGIEAEPIPPGLSRAEEDALIARPIAEKAKILSMMEVDAKVIANGEDPLMMARSELLLVRAHEHMAGFLRDCPVPTYLDGEPAEVYLDTLENNALVQEESAAEALEQARQNATEIPSDHPIHDRLK